MTRVTTGSRLHFGIFSVPAQEQQSRQFGGVGLMIEQPALEMIIERSPTFSGAGPSSERALDFARRFDDSSCVTIHVQRAAPEHKGLGAGTQLALAVGSGLCRESNRSMSVAEIARRVGRGLRSALGIHGFEQGGFLVEAGKGPHTEISPLVARLDFPDDWRIVLVSPGNVRGLHGAKEIDAFAELARAASESATDKLCRLTILGMLPALAERDLASFGESLHEFNRLVGEMFRPAQGSVYAHPLVEQVVDFMRKEGVPGVGQSSWGPTTFAVTEPDRVKHLVGRLRQRFSLDAEEVVVTRARNRGAAIMS